MSSGSKKVSTIKWFGILQSGDSYMNLLCDLQEIVDLCVGELDVSWDISEPATCEILDI